MPSTASPDTFSYTAEVGRKALHLVALVIPLGMWWFGAPLAFYLLSVAVLIAAGADVLRAYSPTVNEWIRWGFGFLMRAEELPAVGSRVTFNGATCVLVGATLLTLLVPIRIAVPVLTMTMLSDAAAALVGRRFGRHSWGTLSKTVEGSGAFVGTGLVVILSFPSLAPGPAIASVVVAAIVEALPIPVNDNIRVPLAAAAVLMTGNALLYNEPLPILPGLSC